MRLFRERNLHCYQMSKLAKGVIEMKLFFCLIFIQIGLIQPSRASEQVEDFFREQFKTADVIYLGEFHTVAEHKELLAQLLKNLMLDGTVDGFAFEFTKATQQSVFEQFLNDQSATPGSEKEFEYFKQLNWKYQNMFNVQEYDAIMRLMKQIWIAKKGQVVFCAIDAQALNSDQEDAGPKYKALKALPQLIQDEIVKVEGKSIEQEAKDGSAYDREATMGVNIANCAARAKKIIAYVGLGHAIRTERLIPNIKWRTAATYTEIILPNKSVKSAFIAQGYYDPYDLSNQQLPMFSEQCLASKFASDFTAYQSASVPNGAAPCLIQSSPDGKNKISYAQMFDYVVLGPKGSKIKPTSTRQWR